MTASRNPRIRGLWLAGLISLTLLTFGIIPHSAAAGPAKTPSAPVIQTATHLDPVLLTRESQPQVTALKSPVPYGDLVFAAVLLGLIAWLLAARPGARRSPHRLIQGTRLSRAPPLTA